MHKSKLTKGKLEDSLYLTCLAVFFSAVWLLPNHYPPWGSFHSDALSASILLIAASVVFWSSDSRQSSWHWPTLIALVCALIPILQYGFGQILWFGTAWINCAYLLGFSCAMALGSTWEKQAPGYCGDFLFTGIVTAATLSMLIGLCQWLRLDVSDVWLLKTEGRPHGNLGQPNQLASLYVLAILGCAWFYNRIKMSLQLAAFLSGLLLVGLAMSDSRTGWVNAVLVSVGFIGWSLKSKDKKWGLASIVSLTLLGATIYALPFLSALLDIQRPIDWASRPTLNGRTVVWQLMRDAAAQNLFLGYGWGQASFASLNVAVDHPRLDSITDQSHNLFLDLIIWNGLVIGGFICIGLICWMLWIAKNVRTLAQLLMFLCLCVLLLHAMAEYPLHYAYFLLPAGMIAGVLTHQLNARVVFTTSRKPTAAMFLIATFMLVVTVKDYMLVESSFQDLRFEKAGVKTNRIGEPPDVWVLTNLRAAVVMGRWKPTAGMSAQELNVMQNIVLTYPSVNNIYTIAVAYGLNGQKENASRWLQIGCKTTRELTCQAIKYQWTHDERLVGIPWPSL